MNLDFPSPHFPYQALRLTLFRPMLPLQQAAHSLAVPVPLLWFTGLLRSLARELDIFSPFADSENCCSVCVEHSVFLTNPIRVRNLSSSFWERWWADLYQSSSSLCLRNNSPLPLASSSSWRQLSSSVRQRSWMMAISESVRGRVEEEEDRLRVVLWWVEQVVSVVDVSSWHLLLLPFFYSSSSFTSIESRLFIQINVYKTTDRTDFTWLAFVRNCRCRKTRLCGQDGIVFLVQWPIWTYGGLQRQGRKGMIWFGCYVGVGDNVEGEVMRGLFQRRDGNSEARFRLFELSSFSCRKMLRKTTCTLGLIRHRLAASNFQNSHNLSFTYNIYIFSHIETLQFKSKFQTNFHKKDPEFHDTPTKCLSLRYPASQQSSRSFAKPNTLQFPYEIK